MGKCQQNLQKSKLKTEGIIYKELHRIVRKLETEASEMGFELNETKTKIMRDTQSKEWDEQYLRVEIRTGKANKFEKIDHCIYLGVVIDDKRQKEKEMKIELQKVIKNIEWCKH